MLEWTTISSNHRSSKSKLYHQLQKCISLKPHYPPLELSLNLQPAYICEYEIVNKPEANLLLLIFFKILMPQCGRDAGSLNYHAQVCKGVVDIYYYTLFKSSENLYFFS